MAELESAEEVFVGLGLEEADAGVELIGYGDVLVILGEEADEGGVVSSDAGDIGVSAGAELRMAVARCLG